jgi:hypothetical protein
MMAALERELKIDFRHHPINADFSDGILTPKAPTSGNLVFLTVELAQRHSLPIHLFRRYNLAHPVVALFETATNSFLVVEGS